MANVLLFVVAAFVAEIAVASGCTTQIAECSSKAMGITSPAKLCQAYPEVKKCLVGLRGTCSNNALEKALEDAIKGMDASINGPLCNKNAKGADGSPSSGSGGKPNKPNSGAPKTECIFQECMSKKTDCEMYVCLNDKKGKCKDKSIWERMTSENKDMKEKYDSLSKTCGCGSLKPSLLFALAAAIFAFFRSSF